MPFRVDVTVTESGFPLVVTARVNCPLPRFCMACGPTLSTPVTLTIVRKSIDSRLDVAASTVVRVPPFWFLVVAERIVMTSGGPSGVELAELDVVVAVDVTDAEELEGGGSGAHEVAPGGMSPGQGDSWPTMVGVAGGAAR